MPTVKHYPASERSKIIAAVKRGVSVTTLAEKHGITRASIHGWLRDHDEWQRLKRSGQIPPAISRHLAAIKAENRALQTRVAQLEAQTDAMGMI